MMHADKYKPGYFPAPRCEMRWAKKDHIEKPPIWCSVDLRDGNQSLIVPMSLEEKLEFFQFSGKIGLQGNRGRVPRRFSETEYEFLRTLDRTGPDPRRRHRAGADPVPGNTSSTETFEALKGVQQRRGATSTIPPPVAQREQVFKKS